MPQRHPRKRTDKRTDTKPPKTTPPRTRKGPQPAPEPPPLDNSTRGILNRMRAASDRGNPNAPLRRRGRKNKLAELFETGQDDTYAQILEFIRMGASDAAASAAFGIDPATFCRWMREGRDRIKGPLVRQLYLDVNQARGQARSLAEMEVKQKDSLAWLKSFGGRSKPGLDGWTDTINIGGDPDNPLTVNHNVKGEIDHNHKHAHAHLVFDPNVTDGRTLIAEALTYAEEAGLLQRTEAGARMFLNPTGEASSQTPVADEALEVAAKKVSTLTDPGKVDTLAGNGKPINNSRKGK
jgi:hypothetical protein